MTVMIVILYIVLILYWVMLIYTPIICFVGLVTSLANEDVTSIMHNPYFGIIKVSPNKGILIWSIRLFLLGSLSNAYIEWYRHGLNPFIPL